MNKTCLCETDYECGMHEDKENLFNPGDYKSLFDEYEKIIGSKEKQIKIFIKQRDYYCDKFMAMRLERDCLFTELTRIKNRQKVEEKVNERT